jgi:hypothetical protein
MSYTKAQQSIERAREIEQSSAGMMLAAKRALTTELSKIETDRRLTDEGKREAAAAAKQKHAIEFLQKSHIMRQEHVANVKKAIREAEKVIYTPPRKPDATKLGRFEDAFKALKTDLMFATSQRSAYDKLREFTGKLDDPYLANRVREDFAELTTKILAIPGNGNFVRGTGAASVTTNARTELGGLYDGLLKPFESDDLRGARDVLETAQQTGEEGKVHNSLIIMAAAKEAFGTDYSRYMNDTDSFFAAHPEHTPARSLIRKASVLRKQRRI